ncbi:MAG: HdeD family acid-resistance protein [Pseudorhodoplanes sp.]
MPLDNEKLQLAATRAQHRVIDKLGDVWWSLLVRGLLVAALGIAAIIWPKSTLELLVRLVGLYLSFDGIVSLVAAFRARDLKTYLAPGLISVLVGGVLLFWPDVTGRLLLIIVGLWAVLQGATLLWAGYDADANDPDRSLAMTVGGIVALVGVILVLWPGTGAVTISWLIGLAALVIGGLLIFLASRVRQAANRVADLGRRKGSS